MTSVSTLAFWEPIIGDRTRIKCTICAESDTNTSEGVMLKTSKISHVKTKAHKEAVRVLNTQSQNTASVAVSSTQNARYVTMNAWQTFFDNDSGSVNPDSTPEDPFDDVTMNEDIGTYFDGIGNPIQLSAGLDPLASATRLKTHLNAEMDGLELLRTHALFTSGSDLVEERMMFA